MNSQLTTKKGQVAKAALQHSGKLCYHRDRREKTASPAAEKEWIRMKLIIEQELSRQEPEIIIRCGLMDERLKRLIEQIKLYSFSVPAKKDGVLRQMPLEEICYFESVDNRTFLYLEHEVLDCDLKLYELEEKLRGTTFVRISKNCILNAAVVAGVRAQLNGRLEAILKNREKLIVSKHYVRGVREKYED